MCRPSYGSVSLCVGSCKLHCCSSSHCVLIHLVRCMVEAKMAAQRKLGFGKEETIITRKRHKATPSGLASELESGEKDEVEVSPCHSLGLWETKVKRIHRSMVGSSFCGPEPWNSGEELSSKELKLSERERWWMEPSSAGKRGQFSSRKEDSAVNLGLGLTEL